MKKFTFILFITIGICSADEGDQSTFDLTNGKFVISRGVIAMSKCDVFFVAKRSKDQVVAIVKKNSTDAEVRHNVNAVESIIESLNKDVAYIIYGSNGKKSETQFLFLEGKMVVFKVQDDGELFAEIRIPESVFLESCAALKTE